MKLILSEYITSLKEDRELDSLIIDVLRELEIIPLTMPQRGRQYGVDIAAVGPDIEDAGTTQALYLLVVKQGNITRSSWSADTTGVRASLDEIKDVYLSSFVPEIHKHLPIKIIVISNGYIEQNVNQNWVGYTKNNTSPSISYDYWGTDKLVSLIEKAQFTEALFPADVRSLLRKSLVLLDLPTYDYSHYYELLNKLLPEQEKHLSKKETRKRLRLVNSSLAIVHHWAKGYNNVKPALILAERTILNGWDWLQKTSYLADAEIVGEYMVILHHKADIDLSYFTKVKDAFIIEDGLASTGHIDHTEYCLMTYEQIGIMSTIGLTRLWIAEASMGNGKDHTEFSKNRFEEAEGVADLLGALIENNPASLYLKLDEHCIEINLALILLYETGKFGVAVKWLARLIEYLSINYQLYSFDPLWITDYEKLAEISNNQSIEKQESSILLVVLAEWSLILKRPQLYSKVREVVANIGDINLQLWKPDQETALFFAGRMQCPNPVKRRLI